jgi:type I restriction enzyme, S subunit
MKENTTHSPLHPSSLTLHNSPSTLQNSSFIPHNSSLPLPLPPSSFNLQPSSFNLHPSTFITHPSSFPAWTSAIKAKSSAGRGSGKKQEFYGIKKLRELILELAVRGLLVPQDPNDEPASELLKKIASEKKGRMERRVRAEEKAYTAFTSELFKIPKNWKWIGATTPTIMVSDKGKKVQTKDILESGKYPVVDQGKVFIRGYCNDPNKAINVTQPIVLFGDHTRETKLIDFDFVIGADGVKLLQPICINPRFYFLVLRWLPLKSRGYARHFKLLKDASIPLPPLAEQHRIVAKVDELMALCDRLEQQQEESVCTHDTLVKTLLDALTTASEQGAFAEAWQRIASHFDTLFTTESSIDQLKQTILQLAVMGKLVPREFDSTPMLPLCQILSEPSFNGISTGPTADTSMTEVLRISAGTSRDDFHVDESDFKYVDITDEDSRKATLREGDLLACRYNGNLHYVGRFSLYRAESGRTQVNPDKLIRFRVNADEHSPRYICFAMNAAQTRSTIESMCATTAGNIGLSAGRMKTVPIPIPPLAEQHRIVARVDELMALCDRLKARLQSAQTTQLQLTDTLVESSIN